MSKRVFVCVLLVLCLVGAIIAAAPLAAAEKVVLRVAIPADRPENKAAIEGELEKIKRFEATYPDIKVVPINYDYNPQTFAVMQAGRNAPDVLLVWATEGTVLAEKGWLAPIDEYLKTWPKTSWINPDAFAPFTVKGRIYGLPHDGYVKHIMYNKKMFLAKNVPFPRLDWTWKEFIDAAVKLTDRKKGIAGFAPMTRGGEGGWMLTDWIYQAGGEVEEFRDGKWYAVFDSPEAIRGAQFAKDMKWKYNVIPANWSQGYMDVFNLFATEKAAMVPHGDFTVEWVINNFKWNPKDIGLAPMPKGEGPKGRQAGVQGGTFYVINGLAPQPVRDAAFKWLDFERWSDAGLEVLKKDIAERRKTGTYMAMLKYPVLKPGVGYQKKEDEIKAANPDVCVIWPEDLREYLPKTGHTEPPIEAQKLYSEYLAPVYQALLSNRNADPAKLLKEAAAKFQKEVLDPLNK
ncbi:MAG: ABC transporter substrate-binding protein [Bacillota bacterium]